MKTGAATDPADQKLPTPSGLVWQSNPVPVYRYAPDPDHNGYFAPAIDVFYTGVLKGRQRVETLMTRYFINVNDTTVDPSGGLFDKTQPVNSLRVGKLPQVVLETLSRVNSTTFAAREASWYLGGRGTVEIYRIRNGNTLEMLNGRNGNTAFGTPAQRGQLDQASGLVFYRSSLGGQIVVDIRSGTVSFPNIGPDKGDVILATYTPQVMRLNVSHDEANLVRTPAALNTANPVLAPKTGATAPGSNTNPVVVMDRALNPRVNLSSPAVVFGPNANAMPLDRLWVLYRKSDPSGAVKAGIYFKAMRLVARLPESVLLNANSPQGFAAFSVSGNIGPYEVDWARGRVYFTELDEGNQVRVQYQGQSGGSYDLTYRVAWGDEISATGNAADTTQETILPTDSVVNEGQVSAFKDPLADKLWIFWTSTRAGTTDLFYETIAPPFYPTATNQR